MFLEGLWKVMEFWAVKAVEYSKIMGDFAVESWKIRVYAENKIDGGGLASIVSERILRTCLGLYQDNFII